MIKYALLFMTFMALEAQQSIPMTEFERVWNKIIVHSLNNHIGKVVITSDCLTEEEFILLKHIIQSDNLQKALFGRKLTEFFDIYLQHHVLIITSHESLVKDSRIY